MSVKKSYTSEQITVLEGLEAVRARPGMYIGATDNGGMHHLLWEIVNNSIDESLAGYCNKINVVIHNDYTVEVSDNGRGIPLERHKLGRDTPELIFTTLHAGGKFNNEAYPFSGGLHGVGASVVNALSSQLDIEIFRDHKKAVIKFHKNGILKQPLTILEPTTKTGTMVKFTADSSIFKNCAFKFDVVSRFLEEMAYLNNGLSIRLTDKRNSQKKDFYFQEGLLAFINKLSQNQKTINSPVIFQGTEEGVWFRIAFLYSMNFTECVLSFANNIKTAFGGTHDTGFRNGLAKSCSQFARQNNLLKDKDRDFNLSEIKEGLNAIITVKIPEKIVEFEGQTKSRLGTAVVRNIIDKATRKEVGHWLQANPVSATRIIQKLLQVRKIRELSKKERLTASNLKNWKNSFVGKLTPARSKNSKLTELFLVEGDSAEGSAKSGRDSKHQAILPLRGKVINAEKAQEQSILNNKEIQSIIASIGAGYGAGFNINEVKYNKIIIMTDADTDGAHIQVLLLVFFYRYMRDLFNNHRIYLAVPPLYKLIFKKNDQPVYVWNEAEYEEMIKGKKPFITQRYKGLGEMNPDQLWDTTMNPETRRLICVTIDDIFHTEEQIITLMGTDNTNRKNWINENINFDN